MTPPPLPADPVAALMERAGEAERAGTWEEAARLFRVAFRAAAEGRDPAAMADALRGGARVRLQQGRTEEAEELAELSRTVAQRNDLPREEARALNVLAIVLHARRDWRGAQALYETALERALDVGDDELIGLCCQNLGVLANVQGALRAARVRYLESIASSVRCRNKRNELMAYNNLGMVCADLREWMEAEVFFERGIEIAERIGDAAQLARLCANRAEPLIHVGDMTRARETLERAERAALRINAPSVLSDVARFRGIAARLEGDLDAAERHLRKAVETARGGETALERAEALRELGSLEIATGRHGPGRASLAEAARLFEGTGALRDARRAEEEAAAIGG